MSIIIQGTRINVIDLDIFSSSDHTCSIPLWSKEEKELYDKLLASKDKEIEALNKQIKFSEERAKAK
jgi:hypothetical protein